MVDNPQPEVAVIIPTRDRASLLLRALTSACNQTKTDIEIVIVVDGPDAATVAALEGIHDPRLRVICLEEKQGPAQARNRGVQAARSRWVAFLDDDDEWMPSKLSRQLGVALEFDTILPIVSCLTIVDTPKGRFVFPRRAPNRNEPLSEYLFVRRRSPFGGEGYLHTSSLFVPRQLLIELPFDMALRNHEDWDWLLRVSKRRDTQIVVVGEPLCVIHAQEERPSAGSSGEWDQSLAWARGARTLMTPRAYGSFCLLIIGNRAANKGQWRVFSTLLREAIEHGRLTVGDLLLYLGMWIIPRDVRMHFRRLLLGIFGWTSDPRRQLPDRSHVEDGGRGRHRQTSLAARSKRNHGSTR